MPSLFSDNGAYGTSCISKRWEYIALYMYPLYRFHFQLNFAQRKRPASTHVELLIRGRYLLTTIALFFCFWLMAVGWAFSSNFIWFMVNSPTSTRRRDNLYVPTIDANFRGFPHLSLERDRGRSSADLTTTVWLNSSARWLHFRRVDHSASWRVGELTCYASLAKCRSSGCTVASGVVVVVGVVVCNRSQMRTSKCTCLIFGVSIGLDPG